MKSIAYLVFFCYEGIREELSNNPDIQTQTYGVPAASDHVVNSVCSEFQAAWDRGGPPPQISSFVSGIPENSRSEAVSRLLRVDVSMHRRRGIAIETANYENLLSTLDEASKQKAESILDVLLAQPETVVPVIDVLGRYELRMEIGRGAFGSVYRSWDTELERFVAVKVPSKRLETGDDKRLFLREAKAAAKLSREGIVRVLDFAVEEETAYVVFELIDGPSLATAIKHRRFDSLEAAAFIESLARSLAYAHGRGIVHRDIKPANILLDEQNQPWLTDFGLARIATDPETLYESGKLLGTLQYMSPEQANGAPAEQQSDVYSLGVVMYELLAGHRPFDEEDRWSFIFLVNYAEAPSLRNANPDIPADLDTICLKAISKLPEDRYQSAGELADDLARFQNGEPILARPISIFGHWRRRVERHPVIALLTAMLIVSAGVATAAVMRPPKEVVREKIVEVPSSQDGRLPVRFVTEPAGASITLVRLDDDLYEPDPSTLENVPGGSPLTHRLAEGFYLVIATLPDGRFHEVIRRVPGPGTHTRGKGPSVMSWEFTDGVVDYASPVRIRSPKSEEMMALCRPESAALDGMPFYVDCHEFPNHQAERRDWLDENGNVFPHHTDELGDLPFRCEYWIAAQYAEQVGGRLPSLLEWNELIAQLPDETCAPESGIFDVSIPSCDALLFADKPVLGVLGNVPEWLSTRAGKMTFPQANGGATFPEAWSARQYIGGIVDSTTVRYLEHVGKAPTTSRVDFKSVGFRVVRSAHARLTPDAFPPLEAFRAAIGSKQNDEISDQTVADRE